MLTKPQHKSEATFNSEKSAYSRLQHLNIQPDRNVLQCFGWTVVNPKSFTRCDEPTCTGDEENGLRIGDERFLPTKAKKDTADVTYSWDNPSERSMVEHGVDFRPPSFKQSWSWILDRSQFGSDGQFLPSGENLTSHRFALLFEYLPDAKPLSSESITKSLALEALSGFHAIQKAMIIHGDHQLRNLLVTKEGRAVWIDFDRAMVLDSLNECALYRFRKDLIDLHRTLFIYMLKRY